MLISTRDMRLFLELLDAFEKVVKNMDRQTFSQISREEFGSSLAFLIFMEDFLGVKLTFS